jgi:SNF2 family DNA or RNA helicase
MIIKFNQTKTRIWFISEDGSEYKLLMNFPAFLREGPYFFVPAKWAVARNVFQRFRQDHKSTKIKIDKEVNDFLTTQPRLREIPDSFRFFTEPMDFQRIALRYLYTVGSGGILLDPGMGKSKVTLDYIALMGFKKAIIVCPKPLLFVWEDEIKTHRPDLNYHTVKTTNWAKEVDGIKAHQITIINYNKAVVFEENLKEIGYDYIHLDEFLIKDPKTTRTKSITDLSKTIAYRSGGSGTLINNSLMDVFCPTRFLEPSLVGWSYTNFLNRHAVKAMVKRGEQASVSAVVAFKGMDIARSILESCSIVMTKEEWLKGKIPEKRFHDVYVSPSQEQKDIYDSLLRNYIAEYKGEFIEIDNPLVMLSKLYQISNGFLYKTDKDETELKKIDALAANDSDDLFQDGPERKRKPKRKTLFFEEQPKINALREIICEKIPERKSIIWFNMSAELELIEAMLNGESKSYSVIKGGESNIGKKVREFNANPAIQYLVCQAKAVNYGITVLGTTLEKLEDEDNEYEIMPNINPEVHTEIFYSMNFSLEVYLQQQDRIHRIGQKHVCDYYRIFANTSIEHQIRKAAIDKMSIREEILVDIAHKLRESDSNLV